ncbi:hypothetical protein DERP_006131 [Dermatophagoides pteronyssinus]|uniref:Uncharacterized protein n=1 Tax=Dermatophagoides pteronyssinus TaxID=6956 RepID=A0ABQ8JSK3_DERPT|nr:hypothetical protein DERP_006131 [Dermatophagoides pteronyssinus]
MKRSMSFNQPFLCFNCFCLRCSFKRCSRPHHYYHNCFVDYYRWISLDDHVYSHKPGFKKEEEKDYQG